MPRAIFLLLSLSIIHHDVLNAADSPDKAQKIGSLSASKVLFLGNSITLHGPAPKIGWDGNWGMAASAENLDYVHLVTADIEKATGSRPQIKVRNIAEFERNHSKYDIPTQLEKELAFKPDIVIVAIGENVPALTTDELKQEYAAAFRRLLDALRMNGSPAIFVRSSFWPNDAKDDIMHRACDDALGTFVDLGPVSRDPANAARSERKFEHEGVASHPGDKGMRAIADAIVKAIKTKAKASE